MTRVKEELLCRYPFYQPVEGYRYSIDALLLSGFVKEPKAGASFLEIGTGSGIITLLLSKRFNKVSFHAVEIQEELYLIARDNFLLHDLKVDLELGDYRELEGQDLYEYIVANPPFFKDGNISQNTMEAIARHEVKSTLDQLIEKSKKLLKTGGLLYLIYPAKRLGELFGQMEAKGIRPYALKVVYAKEGREGELVLVAGKKNYRGALRVLAPLVIYDQENSYLEEVVKLYKEGVLHW